MTALRILTKLVDMLDVPDLGAGQVLKRNAGDTGFDAEDFKLAALDDVPVAVAGKFLRRNAGGTAFEWADAGTPAAAIQSKIYLGANQAFLNGVRGFIDFNTEVFDADGCWTGSRFTAVQAGIWMLELFADVDDLSGGYWHFDVFKNGDGVTPTTGTRIRSLAHDSNSLPSPGNLSRPRIGFSFVERLAVNDKIDFVALQTNSASKNIWGGEWATFCVATRLSA